MITAFFAGMSVILFLNSLKLWFDTLELNSKLREAEFQVSVIAETIEKLIEEKKTRTSNDHSAVIEEDYDHRTF